MKNNYIQIETTFANETDAEKVAKLLLDKCLVACAQYCEITSMYTWEGQQRKEKEVLLKVKTQAEFYKDCEKLIKETHPYKVPQITVTAFDGSEDYLDWVRGSTKKII